MLDVHEFIAKRVADSDQTSPCSTMTTPSGKVYDRKQRQNLYVIDRVIILRQR